MNRLVKHEADHKLKDLMRISKAVSRHSLSQLSYTDSDSVQGPELPRLFSSGIPPAPPAASPCKPPSLNKRHDHDSPSFPSVGQWRFDGPTPPCQPDHAPGLLGLNTVIVSLAFVLSGVVVVCAANKWYEYLVLYTPAYLEEYNERVALHEETVEARRSAAATAAAEEEAAHSQRMEELYLSIPSTSARHDNANLMYRSSGSSSPEIHPASPSSSSDLGSPPGLRGRSNFGQMLFASRPGDEPHTSR